MKEKLLRIISIVLAVISLVLALISFSGCTDLKDSENTCAEENVDKNYHRSLIPIRAGKTLIFI